MKKILSVLAAAAAFLVSGCMQEINMGEPPDTAEEEVTAEITQVSENGADFTDERNEDDTSDHADNDEIIGAADDGSAQEGEAPHIIEENSSEQFFLLFDGADPSDGYLGDSMKEVLDCIPESITVKKLKKANVEKAVSNGTADKTLFAFTMTRSDGIIPVDSGGKTYYASGFTASDGEDFTVVFGSDEFSSPEEAAKYISTCSRVDYLAVCADTDDRSVVMPIASGNSRDGVYAVIPNAKIMGFDMSELTPFEGMSDSFNIFIESADFDSDSDKLQLHYSTESSFSRSICFRCEEIFVNGKPAADSNYFPIILYDRGTVTLDCPEYSESDIFYFKGNIFAVETSEELCPIGIASCSGG